MRRPPVLTGRCWRLVSDQLWMVRGKTSRRRRLAKRLATVRRIGEGESAMERRLTAAAVNRPLALLRHLLRMAHEEWEAIERVRRIRLEKEPQGRLRWLTQEEITRLIEAAAKSTNKELRSAVIVAPNTSLRLGELIGLTWERVDLSRGVIRLELTKSGRRREVPMNDASLPRPRRPGTKKQRPSLQDPIHQDRLQQRRRGGPA
jgi:integrase